eukprot:2438673-Amphidinium_carterae.1
MVPELVLVVVLATTTVHPPCFWWQPPQPMGLSHQNKTHPVAAGMGWYLAVRMTLRTLEHTAAAAATAAAVAVVAL